MEDQFFLSWRYPIIPVISAFPDIRYNLFIVSSSQYPKNLIYAPSFMMLSIMSAMIDNHIHCSFDLFVIFHLLHSSISLIISSLLKSPIGKQLLSTHFAT